MDTQNKPVGVPEPVIIPEDNFDEYLEWTPEEEEEFLRVFTGMLEDIAHGNP